jgi:uncharacterized protein (DUF1330 family)
MKCYFIAQINIHDQVGYDKYLEGFDQILERYNGKVLVVDDHGTILEGNWPYGRTVIIRFPSKPEALKWYNSADYQQLAKYRWQASTANIILVESEE